MGRQPPLPALLCHRSRQRRLHPRSIVRRPSDRTVSNRLFRYAFTPTLFLSPFVSPRNAPLTHNPLDTEQLTEAAKKAAKKAKKKAAAAAAKVTSTSTDPKSAQQSSNEDKGLEPPSAKDDDPDGLKLLSGEPTPVLDQAWKFLQPLVVLKGNESVEGNVGVWVAVYDVAVRRGRYLQAVGALEKAKRAGGEGHPEVHVRIVDLKSRGTPFFLHPSHTVVHATMLT